MNTPEQAHNIETGASDKPKEAVDAGLKDITSYLTGQQKADLPAEVSEDRAQETRVFTDGFLKKHEAASYANHAEELAQQLRNIA